MTKEHLLHKLLVLNCLMKNGLDQGGKIKEYLKAFKNRPGVLWYKETVSNGDFLFDVVRFEVLRSACIGHMGKRVG